MFVFDLRIFPVFPLASNKQKADFNIFGFFGLIFYIISGNICLRSGKQQENIHSAVLTVTEKTQQLKGKHL